MGFKKPSNFHFFSVSFFTLATAFLAVVLSSGALANHKIEKGLQARLGNGNPGEEFAVRVVFERQDIASLQGGGLPLYQAQYKQQVFDALRDACSGDRQGFDATCDLWEHQGRVHQVTRLWIVNEVAVIADAATVREIAAMPEVRAVLDDPIVQLVDTMEYNPERDGALPNDSGLWGLEAIRAREANEAGHRGENGRVAVVDTGIDQDHWSFQEGQILLADGKSMVPDEPTVEDGHGHGTHVSGTIAGSQNRDGRPIDYFGVTPGGLIVPIKVLSAGGSGRWSWVASGWEWGAQRANIVSASLGGRASRQGNPVEEMVKTTYAAGVLSVIAAGNSGPSRRSIGTPGVVDIALTIGAVSGRRARGGSYTYDIARFSSRGPTIYGNEKPDLSAPGVGVTSGSKNGGTGTWNGTSMATPHVAGLVNMIWTKFPNLTVEQVRQVLMATVSLDEPRQTNVYGHGVANCMKTLAEAERVAAAGS